MNCSIITTISRPCATWTSNWQMDRQHHRVRDPADHWELQKGQSTEGELCYLLRHIYFVLIDYRRMTSCRSKPPVKWRARANCKRKHLTNPNGACKWKYTQNWKNYLHHEYREYIVEYCRFSNFHEWRFLLSILAMSYHEGSQCTLEVSIASFWMRVHFWSWALKLKMSNLLQVLTF